MPNLSDHQRAMLGLLKGHPGAGDGDPYVAGIAGSKELQILREVALFWRALALKARCPWMTKLLLRLGLHDALLADFYANENVSPYAGRACEQFIRRAAGADDPLIAAMAGLEAALMRVRRGEQGAFAVDWDRNPDLVFLALRSDAEIPGPDPENLYRLHISPHTADLISCERIAREPAGCP